MEYDITWTVNIQKVSANDDNVSVDMKKFNMLKNMLKDYNMEVLAVNAEMYLQSGFIYQFNMNLKCMRCIV